MHPVPPPGVDFLRHAAAGEVEPALVEVDALTMNAGAPDHHRRGVHQMAETGFARHGSVSLFTMEDGRRPGRGPCRGRAAAGSRSAAATSQPASNGLARQPWPTRARARTSPGLPVANRIPIGRSRGEDFGQRRFRPRQRRDARRPPPARRVLAGKQERLAGGIGQAADREAGVDEDLLHHQRDESFVLDDQDAHRIASAARRTLDGAADHRGVRRDHGVAERLHPVHPAGKPIIHSR